MAIILIHYNISMWRSPTSLYTLYLRINFLHHTRFLFNLFCSDHNSCQHFSTWVSKSSSSYDLTGKSPMAVIVETTSAYPSLSESSVQMFPKNKWTESTCLDGRSISQHPAKRTILLVGKDDVHKNPLTWMLECTAQSHDDLKWL